VSEPAGPDPAGALAEALASLDLSYESPRPGAYLVRLAGQHKLATMTWLIAGTHSLHVEAFFCRQPDENHAEFYRFLLEHNARMYGVHFALDPVGDVYLVGRQPLEAISADEVDRLLGCVLSYADETFDRALMLGFASAIRKEYAWRVKRGESLANLQAFGRITGPASRASAASADGSGHSVAGQVSGGAPGGAAGPRLAGPDFRA
jgi:putative sensory transduction regulator